MNALPESYPTTQHLPFNEESLKGKFRPAKPDKDPGGEGSWVIMRGTELLLWSEDGSLCLPDGELPETLRSEISDPLFFGWWEDRPCRAARLGRNAQRPHGYEMENLLGVRPRISISLLSLGGMASQILHWERNSRFCSRCGGGMDRLPGEWGKNCPTCSYAHFPHIHPCAIVLVSRGDELLLTRKLNWTPGRYGLVAGFLEFGECLEEAAAREVLEETGIRIKNIRYVGSQSWPFPSQLMAGFVADYEGGDLQVEEDELEDARWFHIDDLPVLPPRRSIARFLIDHYLQERG